MSRLGSPQAASRRVAIAKPKNDIYVALLAIALFAVLMGCVLLFLEWNEYGRSTKVTQSATPSVHTQLVHSGSSATAVRLDGTSNALA